MQRIDQVCVAQDALRAFLIFSESPGVLDLTQNKFGDGLYRTRPDWACSRRLAKPPEAFKQLTGCELGIWGNPG